jgi:hypothetical protein
LWSTRRRKELTKEQEDYTFAQIGRVISDEWKKVEGEPLEKLKEEAEKLNFEGVRKLPKDGSGSDGSGSDSWSEDEDPSFSEKPKIKREASERSSRARKRPSFFQEYENEEDNLDKILDEFEQEQILEQRTPRAPKPKKEVKNPGSRPRKRKTVEPTYKEDDNEIEMETSRSGRVRKIRRRKVFHFGDEDKSEESGSDGGQDDYKPDSDGGDEPDEEYGEAPGSPSDSDDNSNNDENGYPLPLKKRKSGAAMTKEDIEAAKRAAFAAKPHIEVNAKKLRKKDYRDEIDTIIKAGEEDYQDFSDDELSQVLKMQNIKKEPETEPLSERTDGQDAETDKVPEDVSLNTPMSKHDEADDGNGSADENNENDKKAATVNNSDKTEAEIEEGGDLEGSVTAESPQGNFDSDDENQDQDKSERGPVNGNSAEQTGSASFNKPETGLGMKETSAEEDLLTSTEATSMEEGDEQYKNMIAETQMENIFN